MKKSGTNIVAGTSPTKAGTTVDDIPVYATIADIKRDHKVDTSVIFVPAPYAKAAIIEAIDANVPLIICITEGVPIHDMLYIKSYIKGKASQLIGPNCPGILLPSSGTLGIIPASMGLPGSTGVVSRSGTLTYETVSGLSARGIGQRYVIGIGGDPIRGTGFIECLELFERDPLVDKIVLIGEIGGNDEQLAADYIRTHVTKPVYAYIAGHHAPVGVQLGHAGAILGSDDESAGAKSRALEEAGATVSRSISRLVASVK
ncbi:Succinyl-CoA ligase [ADP-forming] subunit alpha [compost metagenome]